RQLLGRPRRAIHERPGAGQRGLCRRHDSAPLLRSGERRSDLLKRSKQALVVLLGADRDADTVADGPHRESLLQQLVGEPLWLADRYVEEVRVRRQRLVAETAQALGEALAFSENRPHVR